MADMLVSGTDGIQAWFDGVTGPSGPLAKPSEPKAEVTGQASRGSLEGAAVGAAVGLLNAFFPGKVGAGVLGIGALGMTVAAGVSGSRDVANVAVGLSAIAAKEVVENMAASKAGTTAAVMQTKAANIAAHGDIGGENSAEDPLVAAGRRFDGMR